MSRIETNGEPYRPEIVVTGVGDPLVFVPGMDGTGKLFYRQIPRLAPAYRVTTYRLRDAADRMEVLIADLEQVIESVSPNGSALLVGESFGGTLAMSFTLARPARVSALVVLNSFARFLPQFRLRLAQWGIRAMPWRAMSLVRRLTAFRLHSRYTHREEIRRFLELTAQTTQAGYLNRLRILSRYDFRSRLRDIRIPTLFLAADRDHLVPAVQQARYMAERVSGAELRILEGHGHICLIAPGVDLRQIIDDWRPAGP